MGKNRKKLLLSSLAMLLVSALALSTATFAWFTSGNEGNVTGIQFTVDDATGMQISSDALDWKSTLDFSEIKTDQTSSGNFAEKLAAYSSVGAVSGGKLALFSGTQGPDGTMTSADVSVSAGTEGNFYRFDLYVKNEGAADQTLKLKLDSSKVEDAEGSKEISKAVRVAFIDQQQGGDGAQTIEGVKAAALNSGTAVIWEPNAATHTTYAKTYRYQTATDTGVPNDTVLGNAGVQTYLGINAATSTGMKVVKGVATTGSVAKVTTTTTSTQGATVAIAALPANKITKVTVYIWIEGQDVDCNNADASGVVNANFDLIMEAAATQQGTT